MRNIILFFASLFFFQDLYAQKTLTATDEGSKVHFVIKNFGIKTGGDLSGLKATIHFDQNNVSLWSFDATVETKSIDTDNNNRDGHLKRSDYFDIAKYPVIHIVSTYIQATSKAGVYQFNGKITMKGVTKPLQFPFKVNAVNAGYLFTGNFELNRRDFNVGESSISLSDNLKVSLSVLAK